MNRTEMLPVVRERLLGTMLRELGKRGRDGISVTAVLSDVRVSPGEYAAEFADLDACLDCAYQELTAGITGAVRTACADLPPGSERLWAERVRRGLEVLLAELAADPLRARVLMRTYPALGNHAQARYQAFVDGFAPFLTPGRELSAVTEQLPDGVEMLALGAAEAIVFDEVASDRTEALPGLLPAILFSVLVPFLGSKAAAAEMEKAQR